MVTRTCNANRGTHGSVNGNQRHGQILPSNSLFLLRLPCRILRNYEPTSKSHVAEPYGSFAAIFVVGAGHGGQPDPHSVPVVDGGIGPCSADFVITDTSGSPVYAAKIDVHIAYGFMSVRKLDLEVSTNVDGKGRFTGLPNRVKSGLFFKASDPGRSGDAFDDPSSTCKAQFTVVLRKAPQ